MLTYSLSRITVLRSIKGVDHLYTFKLAIDLIQYGVLLVLTKLSKGEETVFERTSTEDRPPEVALDILQEAVNRASKEICYAGRPTLDQGW